MVSTVTLKLLEVLQGGLEAEISISKGCGGDVWDNSLHQAQTSSCASGTKEAL